MRNWHKFGAKLTKNLVRNRSQFWCEIDLNLVRNRSFYQTGFGAKLTSLLYWIWCEIYLFILLNLVRNRPKFGAKSTFLPLWIWCEINLNLVPNRHTIWKLTEFLRGENGFWSRQRAQQFLLCHDGRYLENQAEGYGRVASARTHIRSRSPRWIACGQ